MQMPTTLVWLVHQVAVSVLLPLTARPALHWLFQLLMECATVPTKPTSLFLPTECVTVLPVVLTV